MYRAGSAPLNVVIIANGEDALRLQKRVRCAARGLGLEISVAEQRANAKAPVGMSRYRRHVPQCPIPLDHRAIHEHNAH